MTRTSDARERLVRTAARLFLTRSYRAVGVDELCAAADVRKGSFYYFFRGKAELAKAVIDAHAAALWARLDDAGAATRAGTHAAGPEAPPAQGPDRAVDDARPDPAGRKDDDAQGADGGRGGGPAEARRTGGPRERTAAARLHAVADAIGAIQTAFQERFGTVVGCPFGNLAAELATTDDALREHLAGVFTEWEGRLARLCREAAAEGALRPGADPDRFARILIAQFQGMTLLAKTGRFPAAEVTAALHQVIDSHLTEGALPSARPAGRDRVSIDRVIEFPDTTSGAQAAAQEGGTA